jgi:hypothetical protein
VDDAYEAKQGRYLHHRSATFTQTQGLRRRY